MALGLAHIGRPAISWLGVPIQAGAQVLGVIAVQSYSRGQHYDRSHQEVLVTIAAQAAVAIQNARLYARTDEALARRVQELDSILQTTQEGILLLDLDRRVVAANRALAEFLGLAQSEVASGTPARPALLGRIGYTAAALAADCHALAIGRGERQAKELTLPGPPERHVARTLAPVRDREGAISGWLLVFRDLTEERELARLRQELTDMLVHDLRSPLTVLLGSLELVKTDLAPGEHEEIHEVLALAEQSGDQMLRLVNNLLEIGRLESGQVLVRPHVVDMPALMETVAARLTPLAAPARIRLEVVAEADLPPLQADPEIMERVLHNLVDNAIKYSPDGGRIQIWARLDGEEPAEAMLVGVSDEGPGIPVLERPLLFQKFRGVRDSAARRRGTGLGLPFCKLAVEAHGGQIWLEDGRGPGSTFVLRLPLALDDENSPTGRG
jgi:signal transduction histidine kinase